jgi:hypothetical protein
MLLDRVPDSCSKSSLTMRIAGSGIRVRVASLFFVKGLSRALTSGGTLWEHTVF